MGSGISREIFSSGDVLINSIDFDPAGRVMWISDAAGGVTHLDIRMGQSKATWYGLSGGKVGSVSVNSTRPHFLLTASNSRALRFVDLPHELPWGFLHLVFAGYGTRESWTDSPETNLPHLMFLSTTTRQWKSSARARLGLRR